MNETDRITKFTETVIEGNGYESYTGVTRQLETSAIVMINVAHMHIECVGSEYKQSCVGHPQNGK